MTITISSKTQNPIVNSELSKVRLDLADAAHALGTWYDSKDGEQDLHTAAEALLRAIASISNIVEQLAVMA